MLLIIWNEQGLHSEKPVSKVNTQDGSNRLTILDRTDSQNLRADKEKEGFSSL